MNGLDGFVRELDEIEQTLGKALGYPWYMDDQKSFPGAIEENGVCVGEHVPATLAAEAAKRITTLEAENARLREAMEHYKAQAKCLERLRAGEEP